MSEKELEERVMLTQSQYLQIEKYLKDKYLNIVVTHQKNRYFDDDLKRIHANKDMLRIRSFTYKKDRELTYKKKGEDGDIEFNQIINQYWFNQIIHHSRLPQGEVKNKLLEDNIDIYSLSSIIDLRTRRLEVKLHEYTIVLDANLYANICDYDLEIESKISKEHAKKVILDFCSLFNLEYKNDYPTKSNRAFKAIGLN